mmetsp:Transcript_110590/g.152897  ORF Transcript_110590/g.152897 Transcript_110590/m.152897 type:complete len:245 (+) Transcript_110590:832-1566(+)
MLMTCLTTLRVRKTNLKVLLRDSPKQASPLSAVVAPCLSSLFISLRNIRSWPSKLCPSGNSSALPRLSVLPQLSSWELPHLMSSVTLMRFLSAKFHLSNAPFLEETRMKTKWPPLSSEAPPALCLKILSVPLMMALTLSNHSLEMDAWFQVLVPPKCTLHLRFRSLLRSSQVSISTLLKDSPRLSKLFPELWLKMLALRLRKSLLSFTLRLVRAPFSVLTCLMDRSKMLMKPASLTPWKLSPGL